MNLRKLLSLAAIALLLGAMIPAAPAAAAEFTDSGVIFEAMDDANVISTTVGDRVIVYLKPATVGTEIDTKVVFPTGFTVNATAANWTTATTNLPATINGSTVTALTITGSAANLVSGQAVTFPHADLTVGTLYAFAITGGLTMPDVTSDTEYTNGAVGTEVSGPTSLDASEWATEVLNGTSGDNIAVSATVDANFEFTLDTTAIALGTLSDSAVTSGGGNQVTIATNAEGGWTVLVKSANKGLTSAAESNTIAATGSLDGAPSTISANTQDYGMDVDVVTNGSNGTGGAPTSSAEYNASSTQIGSLNSDAFQEAAFGDGTTDGDVIAVGLRATIGDWTKEATDYADTLTVVGAGSF